MMSFSACTPRGVLLALAAAWTVLLAPVAGRADLLPIAPNPDGPIILGVNGTLTYDATTHDFAESATALSFTAGFVPGGTASITGGTTSVDLFVDNNGNFLNNGGGIDVTGTMTIGSTTISGALLTGDVVAFGAQAAGPPSLEFNGLFTITGGLLTQPIPLGGGGTARAPYTVGMLGGFQVTAEGVSRGILGDFSADFSGNPTKDGYFNPLPEPGTLMLAVLGTAGLGGAWGLRRLRRGSHS
jgi:hypothetical protein